MFKLPDLPYDEGALSPHMSKETLRLHHGKHHQTYVDELNKLVAENPWTEMSLEEVIMHTHGSTEADHVKIFNNAAQCWNHEFFWSSMKPGGGGDPTGEIGNLISDEFGGTSGFQDAFRAEAKQHFGSGWCWLVLTNGTIEIVTTHDADLPLAHGGTALLTCDLWEHAYYLDYQNKRADFVDAYLGNLINWDFANENLAREMVD